MVVAATFLALFFDVRDFPAGGHFAVLANDAAAPECGETEQSNKTHDLLQLPQGAMCMPAGARPSPSTLLITLLSANVHKRAGARRLGGSLDLLEAVEVR